MRFLSLAALAVTSLFVGIGLAQSAVLPSFHSAASVQPLVSRPVHGKPRQAGPAQGDGMARYIVRLQDAPVALYGGGIAGYRATNPHVNGLRSLDANSPEVRAYAGYLETRQEDVLRAARQALGRDIAPQFRYRFALDGVSVRLTRAEALRLAQLGGVASVQPVRYYRPYATVGIPASASDTNASRAWINAPAVWQLPTDATHGDNEGEGIVVADIDTGINSMNSSFADPGPLDNYSYKDPLGSGNFLGVCDPSNSDQSKQKPGFFSCNNKLIGAYTFTQDTGNDNHSPEDSEGHGSHTASTIAGNFVDVSLLGGTTRISGVAPHANIIAYDVCDPTDLCGSDASVAAVEQAIQDQTTIKNAAGSKFKGMVINFSIGGGEDPYNDPVESAFLSAVEAGIYVSASGGNGGPENTILNDPTQLYPVEHLGPWVASTAAATHDGTFGSNDLENYSGGDATTLAALPASMTGAGVTVGFGPATIVYAGDYVGDDPVQPTTDNAPTSGEPYPQSLGSSEDAKQCLYPFTSGTFPSGAIVVCDRGTIPLVDKAYNVEQGGAGAVVIATTSTSASDSPAESYVIPGTLIDQADGDLLRAWLAASVGAVTPAQAQLSGSGLTTDTSLADQVAGFSSRGPVTSTFNNLVKPDLTAPGVSVLAAVSNPKYTEGSGVTTSAPESYDFFDGTSMASPHDTGSGALLMQLHPDWSPAEIRSALMLTAVVDSLTDQCASLDSGSNCVASTSVPSPLVRGAGRIDVEAASRTGLVLDETGSHYEAANPDKGGDLTLLNLPSVANGNCVESCSWTRTVTSALSSVSATYTVSVSHRTSGVKVTVSPASFTLAPGETQALTIQADVSGVAAGTWAFAQIDLSSGDTTDDGQPIAAMHIPLAVQSVAKAAHMSVNVTSLDFSVDQGDSATQDFIISNDGQADLDWKANSVATQSLQAPAPQWTVVTDANSTQSDGSVWDQPNSGAGSGIPSGYFTPDGHGIYSAEHFVLPVAATLSRIFVDGFAQDGSGPVALSRNIRWYIYADKDGAPKGNPDNGKGNFVWHYSAAPTDPGVTVGDTTSISLDLAAAGQPDLKLDAGTYWLIVAPVFDAEASDPNGAAWYWFEGTSADTTSSAMLIDPANIFGQGKDWQALNISLAMELDGALHCSGTAIEGFKLSVRSGTVHAGISQTVTATFSSASLATGTYGGSLCLKSNASDHPLIALPVSATVSKASGGGSQQSSGGGGGTLDLLSLGILVSAWSRRRRNR